MITPVRTDLPLTMLDQVTPTFPVQQYNPYPVGIQNAPYPYPNQQVVIMQPNQMQMQPIQQPFKTQQIVRDLVRRLTWLIWSFPFEMNDTFFYIAIQCPKLQMLRLFALLCHQQLQVLQLLRLDLLSAMLGLAHAGSSDAAHSRRNRSAHFPVST